VGLALVAPLLLVLAGLVTALDRQPPLVGLPRVGRGGRRFTMWKVRTMRGTGGSGSITVLGDDRITPLGARLRRFRLDELPQLWNVVRGDMALIGPRPETPDLVDLDDAGWRAVLSVPPGIAGATQVVIHGREAQVRSVDEYVSSVLPHKVEIDRWYVRHASLAVDVDVLRSVVRSIRVPDGETAVHRRLRRSLPSAMAAVTSGP